MGNQRMMSVRWKVIYLNKQFQDAEQRDIACVENVLLYSC